MVKKSIVYFDRVMMLIEKLLKGIIVFSVAALVIVMSLNIIFRYVLSAPIFWADEFALYMLVWITFLGASICIKHDRLPAITILKDKLNTTLRLYLYIIIQIAILLFSFIILYYTFDWITSNNVANRVSAAMRVPMWIPYSILPLTMFINVLFVLHNILHSKQSLKLEMGSD
ncbi:TRAP transporter small permease [Alkalihalobacillus sp. MEB130]|uniref:TRAP transporter small permease n=1 Tax=Alkalihalobacillus sp. MEB130 TaxID=2976704 RepID=UPI0028DFBBAA|nr:TRAP transporter small permease [Alkalihalobacillus sp. MEB130]MDT8861367.1 TRAP transporter small permease [Alkalihalobacillus sp. MEB130]